MQADSAFADRSLSLTVLGKNGAGMRYTVDPGSATNFLTTLIDLYRQGQQQPLFFMPGTSEAWQNALRKQGDEGEAIAAAVKSWQTSDYTRGDEEDEYLSRSFRIPNDMDDNFKTAAASVFDPLLAHESTISGKNEL
jgi:exonuclease V gamma subunit